MFFIYYILLPYLVSIPVTATYKIIISSQVKKDLLKEISSKSLVHRALVYELLDGNSMWTTLMPLFNLIEFAHLIVNREEIKDNAKEIAFQIQEVEKQLEPSIRNVEDNIIEVHDMDIVISKNTPLKRCDQEIAWINPKKMKNKKGKLTVDTVKEENIISINGDIYMEDIGNEPLRLETTNGKIVISNHLLEIPASCYFVLNSNDHYEITKDENSTHIEATKGNCKIKVYSVKK